MPAVGNCIEFPVVTASGALVVYEYAYGDVPYWVVFVNATLCPASIAADVGSIDMDGAGLTVIIALFESDRKSVV